MRNTLVFIILLLLTIVAFCLDIALGSVSIPWEVLKGAIFDPFSQPEEWRYILWHMRLPNALAAAMVGGGLAVAGLAMQTLFRNPLADASVLGVSGGASLGVALFMMGGVLVSGGAMSNPSLWQTAGMLLSIAQCREASMLISAKPTLHYSFVNCHLIRPLQDAHKARIGDTSDSD